MSKTKPVPDGQSGFIPHLIVNDSDRAMEFYKRAFGAVETSRYKGPDGRMMHASMKLGDRHFFVNDEFKEMGGLSPKSLGGTPVAIMLYVEDVDAVYKRAVDAGAEVKMPLDDQFWGDRYAMLQDPFGHQWEIATHKEDLTPEELDRRGREAMAQPRK